MVIGIGCLMLLVDSSVPLPKSNNEGGVISPPPKPKKKMKELIDYISTASYQSSLLEIQKKKSQGIISTDEAVELCWATLIKTVIR